MNGIKSTRNPYYTTFKLNVISSLCNDFYILPETHWLPNKTFVISNYTVYQNNRTPYENVNLGSGGIAIAIHNSILDCHTIKTVIKGD